MERKLNVSASAGGKVGVKRNRFDAHVDACRSCSIGELCATAQSLWRNVALEALRARKSGN